MANLKNALFVILCAIPFCLSVQLKKEGDLQIKGTAYDYFTQGLLPFTSIPIENDPLGTDCDEHGHFSFVNLCETEYDLIFSHLGYRTTRPFNPNNYFVEQPPANIRYKLTFRPKIKWFDKIRFQMEAAYTFEPFQHPRVISVDGFLNALKLDLNRFTKEAADFDMIPPPSRYFLVDLGWTVTIKVLEFQIQVKNLFNTSYRNYTDRLRYFSDGLGRNIILGVGWNF